MSWGLAFSAGHMEQLKYSGRHKAMGFKEGQPHSSVEDGLGTREEVVLKAILPSKVTRDSRDTVTGHLITNLSGLAAD